MTEFEAVPDRKFRYDFAWPEHKFIIEFHGGIFALGRHVNPVGFHTDREKMRCAMLEGYTVFEYTTLDLYKRPALIIDEVKRVLWEVENP